MLIKRLLILFITALLLSSCTKENKEIITFSSWGSATEVKVISKIIRDFEAENPQIKINFEHIPQNYFQKLHLLFASNQAPDVIFINNLYLPFYADYLIETDELINKNDYFPESLKSMSRNGKLYAVPRDISNLVLYRNLNLTTAAPQNFAELKSIISEIKPFGISNERDVYFMLPYMSIFNENIYNAPRTIAFYRDLENNGAPTASLVGSSTMAQMFLKGQIGYYMSGRWMYPKISEKAQFKWDIITFPGIVPLDCSGWAVSKSTKHPQAAKKFVQYLSSKKSIRYFNSTGLIVPARIDVAGEIDNKIFLEAIKKSKALEINKDFKKQADKLNKKLFN